MFTIRSTQTRATTTAAWVKITARSAAPHFAGSAAPRSAPRAARQLPRICATRGDKTPSEEEDPLAALRAAAATPLFEVALPGAVVIGILALLDAAYSGDWSRIGAITVEQEAQLRALVPVAAGGHAACAACAAVVSARRGERWAPRAAKTLASGFVGLLEVALVPQDRGKE
jgi:hypothetical protein